MTLLGSGKETGSRCSHLLCTSLLSSFPGSTSPTRPSSTRPPRPTCISRHPYTPSTASISNSSCSSSNTACRRRPTTTAAKKLPAQFSRTTSMTCPIQIQNTNRFQLVTSERAYLTSSMTGRVTSETLSRRLTLAVRG